MFQVPLRSRVIVNAAVIPGSEVTEGTAKPVRRLNATELDTESSKFAAQVALSKELSHGTPAACREDLGRRHCPKPSARAVDTYFLSKLQGEEVEESSGEVSPSSSLVLKDLEELMRRVQVGDGVASIGSCARVLANTSHGSRMKTQSIPSNIWAARSSESHRYVQRLRLPDGSP